MARIEKHDILSFINHHKLKQEIDKLIHNGFQPWCELIIVVTPASNTHIFTQAMVKYSKLWPDS